METAPRIAGEQSHSGRRLQSLWSCDITCQSSRMLQLLLHEEAPASGDLLKIALGQEMCEQEEAGLWQEVRLDWVKNWEQSSRTAILLSRHQRDGR